MCFSEGRLTRERRREVLWLSGRYDNVVYALDTATGRVTSVIPVGKELHGLVLWPQPGREGAPS